MQAFMAIIFLNFDQIKTYLGKPFCTLCSKIIAKVVLVSTSNNEIEFGQLYISNQLLTSGFGVLCPGHVLFEAATA